MDTSSVTKRGGSRSWFWGRVLALCVFPGVLWAFVTGCSSEDSGYDPALRYPVRQDVIVVSPPQDTPQSTTPLGNLNATLAAYARMPGGQIVDPTVHGPDERTALETTLTDLFGTPAAPRLPSDKVGDYDTSSATLARGSQVYKRQCASCHSLTGSSRGPGEWMPFPRDYRTGMFKSATTHAKPSPVALARLIRQGVPGSVMQPYDLMTDADLRAVTAYVIHLSQRGETELRVFKELADEEPTAEDFRKLAPEIAAKVASAWQAAATPAPTNIILPTDHDSLRRGHKLFREATGAGCISCHQAYGKEDTFRYDSWGISVKLPDLTRGELRWGREPSDLFHRVRYGIPASGMPSNPNLSDADTLALAAFVAAMSHPDRLPDDVRQVVYPTTGETP
ncbi:MAG: c-type cytochrome [Fimbriiglobus sp.]